MSAILKQALRPATRVTTLPNGLKVVTEAMPSAPATTCISIMVKGGSRFEHKPGVSHFLEHSFFKGTEKHSASQVTDIVEGLGAQLNAFTTREEVNFFANMRNQDWPVMLDILTDMMLHPQLSDHAIESERSVIMQEMDYVYTNDKNEYVMDLFFENAYENQPVGQPILGRAEHIQKLITPDDVRMFYKRQYTPNNMVVVGVGCDIDHEKFVKQVEESLGTLKKPRRDREIVEPDFIGQHIEQRQDHWPLVSALLGFQVCGLADMEGTSDLQVIEAMAGSYNRSQFHTAASDFRPLVRTLHDWECAETMLPMVQQFSDFGCFGIMGQVQDTRLHDFCTASGKFLGGTVNSTVHNATAFEMCKNLAATKALTTCDTATGRTDQIARQFLVHGRRISPEEQLALIRDVTPQRVMDFAHQYFYAHEHVLACAGPCYEMPDVNIMRQHFENPL